MNYKKYIVFGWNRQYPWGGLNDIKDSFGTITQARAYILKSNFECAQLIDRDTWKIIPHESD